MRDHDDFVGEERACGLAQAESRFGRHAPFVPVVVRPVVGEYDFHSQQTGQRCQQCRAHRMDVDDVGFQAFGPMALNVWTIASSDFFRGVSMSDSVMPL